jgi:hypothetical protein
MAEKRSSQLWRSSGVPLHQAWLRFAPADLRQAYEALPWGVDTFRPPTPTPEDAGFWGQVGAVFEVFGEAAVASRTKTNFERRLQADLVARISKGEYELLGFRTEPTRSRGPVAVPDADLERHPPDWKTDTLDIRGEVYVDVRVVPAPLRKAVARRRGRPGSTDRILSVIEHLIAENADFCRIQRPQACERVRTQLRAEGVDVDQRGSGCSDKNIEKLILRKCPKRRIL